MKIKRLLAATAALAMAAFPVAGCGLTPEGVQPPDNTLSGNVDDAENELFENPGDSLGGGGTVETAPEGQGSQNGEGASEIIAGGASSAATAIPEGAIAVTGKTEIKQAGDYYVNSDISGNKITVSCEGVTLYLSDATLSNEKKVIESAYDLTVTLIGENSITNSNADGSNALDCAGNLVVNGSGSLEVVSTKNGISGNSVSIIGATVDITAAKDGIHAEVDAYDDAETQPVPSYSDGGYVYIDDARVTVNSVDDAIQADTFVYITGDNTVIDVVAGGGAPSTITSASSDSASGKGIKAGQIDWGADAAELTWSGYLICIKGGEITVDANDDAIHSNGEILIAGGVVNVKSGDDGVHADDLLQITGGEVYVEKSFEGIESEKIEISGGHTEVQSYEDGINAASGTTSSSPVRGGAASSSASDIHIIISGGYVSVNCLGSSGDGIDSNGSMLISGGEVYVSGSTGSGDAALDSDNGILVNGGYLFAAGSLGMVETPASNSAQNCVSFAASAEISAGTKLYLCNADGEILTYFYTPKACRSIIISCPEIEVGQTYSIYGGDTLLGTFTVSSTITAVGTSSSSNTPGGSPGGKLPGGSVPGWGGSGKR